MPTLSEVYSSHPFLLKQLDFTSLREVPETHAWPRHDHSPVVDDAGEPVPVIDLRDDDVDDMPINETLDDQAAKLSHACGSWGVFQLTGHGVPLALLDLVESECRRLFSLPAARKLEALRPPNGVSGYGVARISSFFSKRMWSEGFTIVGDTDEHARKLWPDDEDRRRFCEVMEEYKKHMGQLARRLTEVILSSLGLSSENERRSDFREASSVLQLNSYPACPDPDRAMGLAAHTDSSLLTILHQSSTSGLQVLRQADRTGPDRWVTVPPLTGALVVNVGDLFHILSNGRYRSVLHRAVVNRTRHRLSVAYIHGPQAHVNVSPLYQLVGPTQRPAYRTVTWQEYLGIKALHFDKALASITTKQDDEEET